MWQTKIQYEQSGDPFNTQWITHNDFQDMMDYITQFNSEHTIIIIQAVKVG